MRSVAQQIVEKLLDDRPVDEGIKDWLSNKWNDVKAVTGIGTDEFGLGKNTEKGWKPKFNGKYLGSTTKPKARRTPPPTGERVWEVP